MPSGKKPEVFFLPLFPWFVNVDGEFFFRPDLHNVLDSKGLFLVTNVTS